MRDTQLGNCVLAAQASFEGWSGLVECVRRPLASLMAAMWSAHSHTHHVLDVSVTTL